MSNSITWFKDYIFVSCKYLSIIKWFRNIFRNWYENVTDGVKDNFVKLWSAAAKVPSWTTKECWFLTPVETATSSLIGILCLLFAEIKHVYLWYWIQNSLRYRKSAVQ